MHQTAVLSRLTPLLTPTVRQAGTGPPLQLPIASQAVLGAQAHPLVPGRLSSLGDQEALEASEVVQVAGEVELVPSEPVDKADGDKAHGHLAHPSLRVRGLHGGTRTAAPSRIGQAGPAVRGAHLLHGPRGLVAVHPSQPPASSLLPPTVLHTPPPASDTSLRRFLAQAPALHRQEQTTPTVSPLQVVRLLLLLWVSSPCYR